ncbi:hypothetical protein PWT90_07299 [Aphanocladium album]|nr:hypothetical protein PWT90_07299 [Aphanocladium album]
MYAGVTTLFRARAIRLGAPRFSATASRRPTAHRAQSSLHSSSSTASSTSTSASTSSPAAAADKKRDAEVRGSSNRVKPTISHTNLARNTEIRFAFRDNTPETREAVNEMLGTAYIPPVCRYPTAEATNLSLQRARRMARIRVGEEMLVTKEGKVVRRRDAADIFGMLKRMTQPRGKKPAMHAMRIVLPKAWDLDVSSSKSVDYVEARTGLAARLRMTGDNDNSTALVLRGQGPALAKAADELIAVCKDVQIFQLGEITSFDYAAQRLWPVIENAEDGGSVLPSDQLDNIWIHKEQQYWLDSAYEKILRPDVWSKESFDMYIKSLVYGRLKPGVTAQIYRVGIRTTGIRVRMIMQAFEDPSARRHITTPVLKMALQFMSTHGGHRAQAESLLKQAEKWGVPLDTDAFNILLGSYVAKHDVRYFYQVLVKMRERCFYPNTRTWLHFLQLLQRDDVRLQVEAAMFDLGFFQDPSTRRGVSVIRAGTLAHQAFRAGERLPVFLDKQMARFGPGWLTEQSTNDVLREFFLFHPTAATSKHYLDHRLLLERLAESGSAMSGSTLSLVLEHCAQPHVCDWDTALWALDRIPAAPPSAVGGSASTGPIYLHLVNLCLRTRGAASLGVVVLYAVVERSLTSRAARTALTHAIFGRAENDNDDSDGGGFWKTRRPRLLSRAMAAALKKTPVDSKALVVRAVEAAVRDATAGYLPADKLVDVLRAALALDRQHETAAAAAAKNPTAQEETSAVDEPAITISMVDVEGDGRRAPIDVCLDSVFEPRRMLIYNQQQAAAPWLEKKKKEEKSGGDASGGSSKQRDGKQEEEGEAAGGSGGQKAEEAKEGGETQSEKRHPLVQYVNSLH